MMKVVCRTFIVLLTLSLLPLGYALANRPPDPIDYYTLRRAHGQSDALFSEYRKLTPVMTDSGYWKIEDFAGRFYNFRDGERVVKGGEQARYNLWIFGNSGSADIFLPDRQTVAQYLQYRLPAYRVRNRAAFYQAIAGQLAGLRETPVQKGDLVIFLDGQNINDDTPRLLAQAEQFTKARGAAFIHFQQPYITPLSGRSGIPIYVPSEYIVDTSHLDAKGAALAARQMIDAITIY